MSAGTMRGELGRAAALTWNLARRNIKAQFQGTVLGRVWSLINPLVTIAVFWVVFGLLFSGRADPGTNSGVDAFALWIAVGVVTWTFISSSIGSGMTALTGNSGLLEKVYFPRYVLVVSTVISTAVTFATELGVLVVVMCFIGGPMVLAFIPLALVFIVLLSMFVTGVGLLLSIAVVWFRDIEHLWGLINQVWMYASGVVFPVGLIVSAQQKLFEWGWGIGGAPLPLDVVFTLNPAQQFLEAFRNLFYDYAVPDWHVWVVCSAWAIGMLVVGALVFRAKQARVVEEL